MKPKNIHTTIHVNANSTSAGRTIVGSLNIPKVSVLQVKCEEAIADYEQGYKVKARREVLRLGQRICE